tara:strand:+ start:234 stop:584 length:351 start_codon:yes stop_codon:yes gene_type:complete
MTQLDMVKTLLKSNPNGVCGTKFLENKIPRFGHHIWDLRTNHNWDIDTLRCNLEGHNHKDKQFMYKWSSLYSDQRLPSGMPLKVVKSDPIESVPMSREEKKEMINKLLQAKGLNKI